MSTVRLLQVRYAASPDGPWGEPEVQMAPRGSILSDWDTATVFNGKGPYAFRSYRVVEYVPLEPAQADADEVERVAKAMYLAHVQRQELGYEDSPVTWDATNQPSGQTKEEWRAGARAAIAALRSRPAVVDAEVVALVEEMEANERAVNEAHRVPGASGNLLWRQARDKRATFLVQNVERIIAALRSGRTK